MHFLSFLNTEMAQVVESLHHKQQGHVADDMVTQSARASPTMVLTKLPQNIPVSAPEELTR